LRDDGGAADGESGEQAERAVLVLARQAGRTVADGEQQQDEGEEVGVEVLNAGYMATTTSAYRAMPRQ
jgi:hypothetical protein